MGIQTIYRVEVFYEGNCDMVEDAYFALHLRSSPEVLTQEAFGGCPAARPYLIVECIDLQRAYLVQKSMRAAVRKGGGKVIEE